MRVAVERDTQADNEDLAARARLILSALDAAAQGARAVGEVKPERRGDDDRVPLHVGGRLRLFADDPGAPPRMIYTRDVVPRAVGFVAPERLPLGYGGTLTLAGPAGDEVRLRVTVTRSRSAAGGWFEGALYFHTPQDELVHGAREGKPRG